MSSPEKFNAWQQKQTEVAQLDYEYAWYAHLNSLSDDLKAIINNIDTLDGLNRTQVDDLINQLLGVQNVRYSQAKRLLMLLLGYFSDYISYTEAIGLGITPSKGLIERLKDIPISASGMVLSAHIDNLTEYSNKKLDNSVRFAWANKQTGQELRDKVVGTAVAKYKDGLIHDQKVKSRAMIDTAVQQVYNHSKAETWGDNGGYKYRLLATLDHSTTPLCRSLDGNLYTYGSREARVPPFHYYCRTVMIPELSEGFEWLRKGRTRSSMYGPTDANQTYDEWLKDNPMPDDWQAPKRPNRRRNKDIKVEELN